MSVIFLFFFFFFFHQIVVLIESWKMLISSKKLISFSKYPRFCILLFSSSFPCQLLLEMMIKINFKVYDVINWLNKILGTLLFNILGRKVGLILKLGQLIECWIRYISMRKCAENLHQKLVLYLFLILVNSPKQLIHVRSSF